MLMTDMDKDDPEDSNKVTLMTVHSAKGLEYKYVYIVGMEENLFPSQRASESADGMEEERRLFYVALTRAKVSATISFAEMRFRWGSMEFSHPSRFLREIDPRYIDSDVDFSAEASRRPAGDGGTSAIDELRRRFDYRFQQKRQEGAAGRGYEAGGHGAPGGGSYGAGSRFGRPADGESGVARRFARAIPQPQRTAAPDPALVRTPRPSTEGMRRLGVRPAASAAGTASAGVPSAGYEVGQRVEHAIFGAGVVRSIELAQDGDQRLVVEFGNAGTKTLLAKFAKLTKL